mmetsp:Transcript_24003/g.50604  ORF Transcript_24003/g.50604 Transcript_24003/m.50604 type:complete len:381 (+) Transcript_24003:141-1283(+)
MLRASSNRGPSLSPLKCPNVVKFIIVALILFTISCIVDDELIDCGNGALGEFETSDIEPRLLSVKRIRRKSSKRRRKKYSTRIHKKPPNRIHKQSFRRKHRHDDEDKKINDEHFQITKPVMYTFFEPVGEGACCGMGKQEHHDLLAVWKKSWEDKGWETGILTKKDAQKHPKFEEYDEKLVQLLGGLRNDDYNRRCFWRWLAMVQVGGGWMSDYDTFPLELDAKLGERLADEEPTFKSYCYIAPCLVHASASEWDRVIHLMMDSLPNEPKEDEFISDMNVFGRLGHSGIVEDLWTVKTLTIPRYEYTIEDDGSLLVDCNAYANKLAVHLCHHSIHMAVAENVFPLTLAVDNDTKEALRRRAEAATVLMGDYNEQCTVSVG